MEKQIFTNEVILSWLQYYAKNTTIDLEHVKIIDITKKNKNVILITLATDLFACFSFCTRTPTRSSISANSIYILGDLPP